MATYSHNTSYNRTYEKKVIEETPRIRITSHTHSPFTHSVIAPTFSSTFPLSSSSFGGDVTSYQSTDDSLSATMEVAEYKPEQLKVSVVGKYIVVEGKHDEKADQFGLIERHFTRKFPLPRNVAPEAVTSSLTADGTLTIVALPPKPKENSPVRQIPIKIVADPAPPQASGAPAPPSQPATEPEKKTDA